MLYLHGHPSDDDLLEAADIADARGLFAVTGDDSRNLMIIITARQLNPDLRIVARAQELRNVEKMTKAGADVTNFTSMPELVRWGCAVEPQAPQFTYMDSFQAVPSVPAIAAAIMDLWQDRMAMTADELEDKRRWTSAAIHGEYSWDNLVAEQWQPFLRRVLDDINQ